MKERRNQCNHNLHLLQSNISTNFYNYWIYFNGGDTHLHGQSKLTSFHIFVSWLNMDINNRCKGRVKFPSSPGIQICFCYLSVSLKPRFDRFLSVHLIIYNQYFDDITKFYIICSLKMILSHSTLPYLHYIYITFRDCVQITSARKGRRWF